MKNINKGREREIIMEKFIEEMEEILDVEQGEVTMDSELDDFECWDSLAKLAFMALAKTKYAKIVMVDQLKEVTTVHDLYELLQ